MTYMRVARSTALMESRALRGWALAGRIPPLCRPIDRWAEWTRLQHVNASTFGGANRAVRGGS